MVRIGDDPHGQSVDLRDRRPERLRHSDAAAEQPARSRGRDGSHAGAQQATPAVAPEILTVISSLSHVHAPI
jgi:hypothetical protein